MRLAFVLYKYFPFGGMQRDCRRLLEEVQKRGHECRVYAISWQGEHLPDVDLRIAPVRALRNHRRNERFWRWVQRDLELDPVEGVIGFNKMPGLDIYFAADPCYLAWATGERGWLYRQGARFKHFAAGERAVFAPTSNTKILLLTETQRDQFEQHYQTSRQRMHLLPPGVDAARGALEDAAARRRSVREQLGLEEMELCMLFVGSGFVTKGLGRAITTLAKLGEAQPGIKARLVVVGQGKARRFRCLARRLRVADAVVFLGGRDDVAKLMSGADLLLHPAVTEAAGMVLLEAVVAGLPVVVTDVCGYARHVRAARAGIVIDAPFSQERLDSAVQRCIDGVYRAECRRSALQYAQLTDLHSMHKIGADLSLEMIRRKNQHGNLQDNLQDNG